MKENLKFQGKLCNSQIIRANKVSSLNIIVVTYNDPFDMSICTVTLQGAVSGESRLANTPSANQK